MTYNHHHYPNGTYRNEGWECVGGTNPHDVLGDDVDGTYIIAPASQGRCSITFPIDIDDLPDGAVITSISLFVKARRLTTKPRPLTLQLSSRDRKERYMSRTIYPSETATEYEVATYQKDPTGRPWDIERCNKIILRLYSSDRVNDCIRVYKYWVRINYETRPSVTIEAPAGTVYTASPTIQWTYTHDDGDPQLKSQIKIFTAAERAKKKFNPEKSPPVYSTVVGADVDELILPTSLNPDTYYTYIRVSSIHRCKSEWANRQFVVATPAPSPPGNDNAGVTGTPGVGVIAVTPNSYESSNKLMFRDSSNLLSVQQADFEDENEPLEYTASNCTIARSIAKFYPGGGEASLSMTSSAGGEMRAQSTYVEVAPSVPITVRAQFLTAATARTCSVVARFYDSSFSQVGSDVTASVTDGTVSWTEAVATGTSHADAVFCQVHAVVAGTASSEIHYVDHVGLMYGTGSQWSNGGFASKNILSSFLATGDDPDPGGIAWSSGNVATTVARAAVSGTGSHGSKMNQMTFTGVSPSIAFRATSSIFTSPTSGTNYTLNKPAGVADNDLLIAFVTSNEYGTITPPAGWTAVNTAAINDGTTDTSLWILKRTGLAADPPTWTDGSLSVSSTRRTAVVVAYSGCASAADQFIAETARTDSSGSLTHTTGTVNNTDSNAWRIAAFAYNDNASGATTVANVNPPSSVSISFVGAATPWSSETGAGTYTINKPSGVQNGDLMIASVQGYSKTNGSATVTAPSGWAIIRQTSDSTGSGGYAVFAVMKRTAGSSEPSSWSGTFSTTIRPRASGCVAYRNADTAANQFIAEDIATRSNNDDITTDTVTNTDSRAWRVVAFGGVTPFGSSVSTSESRERFEISTSLSEYNDPLLSMADSNGPVSTGSHSRTFSTGDDFVTAAAWIGIIKPATSVGSVPNETERVDNTLGSADPWFTTAIYDSNAVVPTGNTSVTAVLTPGSGSTASSAASWIGIIKPASSVSAGEAAAFTSAGIDISAIDPTVLELCGKKITFTASLLGSTAGTAYLTLDFYRANQLISSAIEEAQSYGTSVWTKVYATFDIPTGTTHIRPKISSPDRDISGTLAFDRVGLMLGDSPVWRNGTGRGAHSVWSIPQLQYTEDAGAGYGDWKTLQGQGAYTPSYGDLDGRVVYFDHTVVPLVNRKYRVQTLSYGLAGDQFVSGYGPESDEAALEATYWWLKDLRDLSKNIILKVKAEPLSVGTTNTATVFQPLGEDFPIVLTEGYKGETVDIAVYVKREEYADLLEMLKSGRTLYLQSNMDNAWWVRPVGDIDSDTLVTGKRMTDPIREVKLSFVQVASEE